jgi:hypothetical protein
MRSYREAFFTPRRCVCDKWEHYFEIYDRTFGHLYGRPITYLEIGVYKGGSLEIARSLFGPESTILGLDIDETCRAFAGQGLANEIFIGSQEDPAVLDRILAAHPGIDLVIDDGSHLQRHMIGTFTALFPRLRDGAIYVIEDVATVHSPHHQDTAAGLDVMDYFRGLAGRLNVQFMRFEDIENRFMRPREHRPQRRQPRDLASRIKSITFHESVIVVEKGVRPEPLRIVR